MTAEKPGMDRDHALRGKAEKLLSDGAARRGKPGAGGAADLPTLIHELEVHQVELEMQNEELRRTRAEAEESRARYSELFDFAPIGYTVLDGKGLILDVNLAAADLLGWGRHFLVQKPFVSLLALASRSAFERFFAKVKAAEVKCSCELHMLKRGQHTIDVHLDAIVVHGHATTDPSIQVALVDVTERTRIEAEKARLARELEQTLVNTRRLRGLLPICASCKRIRDDKGYWSQVEQYVSEHSEAEFTHGLCPECAAKLYPGVPSPGAKEPAS